MTTRRKRMNHAQWRGHIEAQQDSGLSMEAYCRTHDLGVASFQHHRSRMRRDASAAPSCGFTELRPVGCALRLHGAGGAWTLELEPGFDVATLKRFLAAVAP